MVEDDASTARALTLIIRRRGWEVVAVSTLAEGLRKLHDLPRLVVLDLMLPDGDGAALLKSIRDRQIATRVVVTTGATDPARLATLRRLGVDLLLQKPVHLPDLLKFLDGS